MLFRAQHCRRPELGIYEMRRMLVEATGCDCHHTVARHVMPPICHMQLLFDHVQVFDEFGFSDSCAHLPPSEKVLMTKSDDDDQLQHVEPIYGGMGLDQKSQKPISDLEQPNYSVPSVPPLLGHIASYKFPPQFIIPHTHPPIYLFPQFHAFFPRFMYAFIPPPCRSHTS